MEGRGDDTPNPALTTWPPQKRAQTPTHPRCEEPPCTTAVVLWEALRCLAPTAPPSQGDAGEPPSIPAPGVCPAQGGGQPLGPGRVGEGDVVQAGPAGKDPLLGDEAMVVALAAPLVVDVGRALVGALWLVVVVGQAARRGPAAAGMGGKRGVSPTARPVGRGRGSGVSLPAVVGWHHAVDVDSITQLHRDHHGEPAGAEPRARLLPGEEKRGWGGQMGAR